MLRKIIPRKIRLIIKLFRRNVSDLNSSVDFAKDICKQSYPYYIEEQQAIKQTAFLENKIHNLRLGAAEIENVVIKENQTISFWNRIGKPVCKRGFKEGRNLIAGELCTDIGGGLCQLSGIMYLTALKAGLRIIERHNHTVDIYKNDSERFAPLGSDATVVYGYKDLRVQNPYDFPVKYKFEITGSFMKCRLYSLKEIKPQKIDFVKAGNDRQVEISTFVNDKLVISSFYKRKL